MVPLDSFKFNDYQGTGKSKKVSQPEASELPSIFSHSACWVKGSPMSTLP